MDLITIYENEDLKVSMLPPALNYLEFLINNEIQLSAAATETVLNETLNLAKDNFSLSKKKIITSSKVPILHRGQTFELIKPYDGLEDAVLLLSEIFDVIKGRLTKEQKINLSNYIKSHYFLTFNKKCDIIFIDDEVQKVSCSIILEDGDNLYILPIFLNEDDFYQKLC